MPKTSSEYLTGDYGFITDYIAEAFHYQFTHVNRYEEVSQRIKLGSEVEGRDEKGIKKTVCAMLKILHPGCSPNDSELEEYVAYAVEGRRRIKEQMNKRKPDDEFAKINLSYINASGEEKIVYCPESKDSHATQDPTRTNLDGLEVTQEVPIEQKSVDLNKTQVVVKGDFPQQQIDVSDFSPDEKHFTIFYDDYGYSYESIINPYLEKAKKVLIEDPYIRMTHQIQNLVRFCEAIVKNSSVKQIQLITNFDDETQKADAKGKLEELKQSLLELDIIFDFKFKKNIHDREISIDNGWKIKIGRGLDFYQKPASWNDIGVHDLSLRKCLETKVDIYFEEPASENAYRIRTH